MITQDGGVPRGDTRLEALGWTHVFSGKVRDLYTSPAAPGRVLVVASDRVSAFDHVLEPSIPKKGALLTQLSLWWFARLGMRNHLAAAHPSLGEHLPPGIAERSMLVHELTMHPIEAVVRGYLVGSGWLEYQTSQSVCSIPLPAGLSNGDRLPEPIYTPAFKAPLGEHDVNISFERTVDLVAVRAQHVESDPLAVVRGHPLEVGDVEGDRTHRGVGGELFDHDGFNRRAASAISRSRSRDPSRRSSRSSGSGCSPPARTGASRSHC